MPRKNRALPRHLLVLRTSAMGDVAMLPHALRALMSAYPDLRVTVASQAMFRPFFAGLEVGWLDVDVRDRHHSLRGMWKLAAEARRLGVDAVADVHDVLRSQAFDLAMRLHGIRVARIRKGRAEKRRFIRCGGRGMAPLRHTVLRYCDVFRHLGFVFDDPAPVVRHGASQPLRGETRRVGRLRPLLGPPGQDLPRAAAPRSGAAARRTLRAASSSTAEAATRRPSPKRWSAPTRTSRPFGARSRFAGEIDLIANLDCVVTMDSLVMHLAALVGYARASRCGAPRIPGWDSSGYGCRRRRAFCRPTCRAVPARSSGRGPAVCGDYRCLTALTPERVVEWVERLIARPKP